MNVLFRKKFATNECSKNGNYTNLNVRLNRVVHREFFVFIDIRSQR